MCFAVLIKKLQHTVFDNMSKMFDLFHIHICTYVMMPVVFTFLILFSPRLRSFRVNGNVKFFISDCGSLMIFTFLSFVVIKEKNFGTGRNKKRTTLLVARVPHTRQIYNNIYYIKYSISKSDKIYIIKFLRSTLIHKRFCIHRQIKKT